MIGVWVCGRDASTCMRKGAGERRGHVWVMRVCCGMNYVVLLGVGVSYLLLWWKDRRPSMCLKYLLGERLKAPQKHLIPILSDTATKLACPSFTFYILIPSSIVNPVHKHLLLCFWIPFWQFFFFLFCQNMSQNEGQGEVMAIPDAVFVWFTAPRPDDSLCSSRRSVMRNSWSRDPRPQMSLTSSSCHSYMPSTHIWGT